MVEKQMTVKLENGLQARPVAEFVQIANNFKSNIRVQYSDKKVNAKSIMGMMSLGIAKGEAITVVADGEDEEQAVSDIEKYISCEA